MTSRALVAVGRGRQETVHPNASVRLGRFHALDSFLERFAAFFSFAVMVGFFFSSRLFFSSFGIVLAPSP